MQKMLHKTKFGGFQESRAARRC